MYSMYIYFPDEFSDQHSHFFDELGSGSAGDELPGSKEDDEEAEVAANRAIKLYKVSDASGEMEVTKVSEQPLKQKDLDQNVSMRNKCQIYRTITPLNTGTSKLKSQAAVAGTGVSGGQMAKQFIDMHEFGRLRCD